MTTRWITAIGVALVIGTQLPRLWNATAFEARTAVAATDREAAVDKVFARWTANTPGCAVGVSTAGQPTLAKGYGMADLEHDVPNAPETIFEAGSVSKQFTAAAVLLLAREGKLSLDDPVRKHVPELPDYGKPLTIRHMLNHTSGLRDWGSVAAIAGWPRTSRVHTHAHVVDIVSRQQSLNFQPGARWSYSNTGFNLSAIIVSRVSGTSFSDFTRDRLFKPLGMTHTSWRDDYTRIVKGRAIAYEDRDGSFRTDMPFENVYGNGGLLTTVGDLLKWNENFVKPVVGDASFVEEQQKPGHFNDGRPHGYALGLFVGTHRGVREVQHSGSTAGYSAFLTRFPEQRLSVAVLCNVTTNATTFAHAVADIYLGDALKPPPAAPTYAITSTDVDRAVGMYRDVQTGATRTLVRGPDGGVRFENGGALTATGANRFALPNGSRLELDGNGGARLIDEFGTIDRFEHVTKATPTAQDLQAYAGTYASEDAETMLTAKVEGDRLVLTQRPDRKIPLTPLYADGFRAAQLGTIVFRRDANRRVVEFSVVQDRVWNMPFLRKN